MTDEHNDMSSLLKNVADQLFLEVGHCKNEHGRLTQEILSALLFVFPQSLLQSLDLVDKRHITRLVTPSGRQLYQVLGSSGKPYCCLATTDYCTCPSYTYTVLVKAEALMCKHLLAVHLAEALGECKEKSISDEEFVVYLCYN